MATATVMVETLGSVQFYDVDTTDENDEFCLWVIGDHSEAETLMERLKVDREVLWNLDDPEFITKFTLVGTNDD